MKLTKVNGVYHASYKSVDGKRRTITTKQTDRDKAETVVEESGIEQIESAAAAGRLSREVLGRILTGKKMTIKKAVEPFVEWMKARGRAPKTIENSTCTVCAWAREASVEDMPPAAINPTHISAWINSDSKRSRSSRIVALSQVKSFFGFCAANGWLASDPSQFVGIDHNILSHEQKEAEVREPFAKDELEKLIANLSQEVESITQEMQSLNDSDKYSETGKERRALWLQQRHSRAMFWLFAVECSSSTGLRLSDIASLEWACFTQGKVSLWQEKTNKRIEHELSPRLESLIIQIQVSDPKYVFPAQHAVIADVKRRALLSVTFKRMCEKIGIPDKSFHCIRHAAATEKSKEIDKEQLAKMLAESLSIQQIQSMLGHANSAMTKKYIH